MADQRGKLTGLRAVLATAVYPLQQLISSPVRWLDDVAAQFASREALIAENARLRDEQKNLEARQLTFSSLQQENIRLRELLQSPVRIADRYLIAELLAINVAPYSHVFVVNRGAQQGVYVGQPVLDARGVVGQVLRVSPFSAEVMLISDPNHGIPVQVNRNGVRTIALGTGRSDRLVMPYLSGSADVEVGDLLVTSGLGGVFPAGYPVATVTAVSAQGGVFAKVSAQPVAPLDRIREVLLVWSDVTSGALPAHSPPDLPHAENQETVPVQKVQLPSLPGQQGDEGEGE
ncbi:MAG: rod shape-determining protein MreC [Pseudomonadota bacterium]